MQGASVRLGPVNGVVYYTQESDGYRVVATLAETPQTAPVRFIAVLQDGQEAILSVAQPPARPALEATVRRSGTHLFLETGSLSVSAAK